MVIFRLKNYSLVCDVYLVKLMMVNKSWFPYPLLDTVMCTRGATYPNRDKTRLQLTTTITTITTPGTSPV